MNLKTYDIISAQGQPMTIALETDVPEKRIGKDYNHNGEPRFAAIYEGRAALIKCLPVLVNEVGSYGVISPVIGERLGIKFAMRGNTNLAKSCMLSDFDRLPGNYQNTLIPPGKSVFISPIPTHGFVEFEGRNYVDYEYFVRSIRAAVNPKKIEDSDFLWTSTVSDLEATGMCAIWMPTQQNPLHVRVSGYEFFSEECGDANNIADNYFIDRMQRSFVRHKPRKGLVIEG